MVNFIGKASGKVTILRIFRPKESSDVGQSMEYGEPLSMSLSGTSSPSLLASADLFLSQELPSPGTLFYGEEGLGL